VKTPSRGAAPLDALLQRGLDAGLYLGAVYALVRDGEIVAEGAVGRQTEAPDRPVTRETIFDLASLTKPIATATSILRLAQEGEFHLGEEVAAFLPGEWGARLEGITLRHLLTHTSGLPAWRDFHSHGWSRAEIVARVAASDREHPIGARYVYSDLGFILLGAVVEHVSGARLDAFVASRVLAPLQMASTGYLPAADRRDRLAATRCPRRGILIGSVHDENAAAMDGVAGHAGLFGTAPDLARYAGALLRNLSPQPPPRSGEGESDAQLPPPRSGEGGRGGEVPFPLSPLVARPMLRNLLDPAIGGSSLGWFTPPNGMLPSGDFLPDDAFGHTGFTGTSLVLVPSLDLAVILLTNRVYQERECGGAPPAAPFLRFRRRFHNAVAGTLLTATRIAKS
jgi:CubicO group peptidase (beta-lactamase class C family)